MSSPDYGGPLYVVQVRHGESYREHCGSCEFADLYDAKACGFRVLRWLHSGHAYQLPEDVLSLRGELAHMGIEPEACVVEVVRLPRTGPNRYDTDGDFVVQLIDCTDDAHDVECLEDTVTEPEVVLVRAEVR